MAKVRAQVLSVAGGELRGLFDGIHKKDRPRACAWTRLAMGRTTRGRYKTADDLVADGKKALAGRAFDPDKILSFLEGLAALFAQVMPIFIK